MPSLTAKGQERLSLLEQAEKSGKITEKGAEVLSQLRSVSGSAPVPRPDERGVVKKGWDALAVPEKMSREGLQMMAQGVTPKTETTGNLARDVAVNTPRIGLESLSEVAPSFVSRGSILTAGGSKVVGAARPLASAVRNLSFKGLEQMSALAPKNEGVLNVAYNDSSLIRSAGKKIAGQLYESAKSILKPQAAQKLKLLKNAETAEQEAANLEQVGKYLRGKAPSPVASKIASKTADIEKLEKEFQNVKIIKQADKLADAGKLDPLMAMRAKRAAGSLIGSKSYDKDALIELTKKFEKIEKTSKELSQADAAYKRSAMADSIRNLAPQNAKGGASTVKATAMALLSKALFPVFSPLIQGSGATAMGVGTRQVVNPLLAHGARGLKNSAATAALIQALSNRQRRSK